MTTVDAAAAWHSKKPFTLAALAAFAAIGLAGCETSNNLLSGGATEPATKVAEQSAPAATAVKKGRLSIAPVIGPPDAVVKQLQAQLTQAAEKQSIGVTSSPTDPSDYTLRGYVVSAKEKTGTKISYIWDVTDPAQKRVNRITGEEFVPGTAGKDPWAAVTPQLTQSIADKTATALGTWLSTQGAASGGTPVASNIAPPSGAGAGAAPIQTAAVPAQPAAAATTGSIAKEQGPAFAIVPSVTGAPGDGNASLKAAMTSQLDKLGLGGSSAGARRYSVLAKVKSEPPKDGKQAISIDWEVKDPAGKPVATVSQNNKVPQGLLDGAWGDTAQHAAEGAAVQIRQLITDHSAGKPVQTGSAAGQQAASTQTR